MNFHILTLFPEMIDEAMNKSIIGRAIENNTISLETVNLRDFYTNKHKKVDDYTYGGGAGMLMQAQPVYDAWMSVNEKVSSNSDGNSKSQKVRTIYVTPQGTPFNQNMAKDFSKEENLVIICGHYEGIDERVLEETVTDYVSIGDYVLTGGELAAMIIVDAVSRLVPGVLHNDISAETESFHNNLLEYPQYSRPKVWMEKEVPQVLLTGDSKKIAEWRLQESVKRTKERRMDLYEKYEELQKCKAVMLKQKLIHIDMIELINRGRAELIYLKDNEILLKDLLSDVYFHTDLSDEAHEKILEGMPEYELDKIKCLVIHQNENVGKIQKLIRLNDVVECYQAVYTLKEKLAVSSLYNVDNSPTKDGLVIKPVELSDYEKVKSNYKSYDGIEYVERRLSEGAFTGAYVNGKLAGFIGRHGEGSIGMLCVLPEYRNKKIAMALETYLINKELEEGMIPYGQVCLDNVPSLNLQKKLGLYMSKKSIFWLSE